MSAPPVASVPTAASAPSVAALPSVPPSPFPSSPIAPLRVVGLGDSYMSHLVRHVFAALLAAINRPRFDPLTALEHDSRLPAPYFDGDTGSSSAQDPRA